MAKLINLDEAPENFELTITTKNLKGADVEIPFTCIGRTLRDWHPIAVRRMAEDANQSIDAAEKAKTGDGQTSAEETPRRVVVSDTEVQEGIERGLGRMSEIITEVAVGWGLSNEYSADNLAKLCSKFPGVHQQLWERYDARIRGDRLGN